MSHVFRIACVMLIVSLFLAPPAWAEEGEALYQVQIGSSKNLKGTKYFATKASSVLGTSTYILFRSSFYVVLTGHYSSREQAQDRLMEVRQHYNGMVVAYDLNDIIAAFKNGEEVSEKEIVGTVFSGETALKAREKRMQTEPIREVTRTQSTGLRGVVEKGVHNVRMEGCTLINTERIAGYEFQTKATLAELDPYTLETKEKHGTNLYICIQTKGKQNKVLIEQSSEGKSTSSRKEHVLSLKLHATDEQGVENVAQALRELINYCATNQ